jgi:hypothetical protein
MGKIEVGWAFAGLRSDSKLIEKSRSDKEFRAPTPDACRQGWLCYKSRAEALLFELRDGHLSLIGSG